MHLDRAAVHGIVSAALAEDIAWGDLTTDSLIAGELRCTGRLVAKQAGVLAGIEVAALVFNTVDPDIRVDVLTPDGTDVEPGVDLANVQGPVAGILKGERVALNFVQRMSGVATQAACYVAAVAGTRARIVDTRKTTPGLRLLEKYAVRVGGAANHRYCLADGVLIKDNHLAALRAWGLTLRDAIALARRRVPHTVRVEVEVESLAEVEEALAAGADAILLDNMSLSDMARAVAKVDGRAITEASGGINLNTVRGVAECGVDLISVGALTHSAPALDISLDLDT